MPFYAVLLTTLDKRRPVYTNASIGSTAVDILFLRLCSFFLSSYLLW